MNPNFLENAQQNVKIFICRALSAMLLLFGLTHYGGAQIVQRRPVPVVHKQRLIVLTDIGAEADDTESMVRLLLYSDVIDIQGLIATTSIWKSSPSPELIRQVIRAYGQVHGNLVKNDPNFPSAESLQTFVKHGLPAYGMKGVGVGKDSEGSSWIIQTLETKDDRPL